jgi:hypothetical protein
MAGRRGRRLAFIAVLVATVLGGTGCVATPPGAAGAGDGCARAIVLAGQSGGEARKGALIRTAFDCTTVDEWTAAVREHPEAIGLRDGATVDPRVHLTGICGAEPTAPVCTDAAAKGLDANWSGR